ncbi:g8939 [Coccomyxa viridis]|uniref:G8939 protein n=1 Tax=Coccomyxa viridis TaxID=1274662 RepID=A0ABP1G1P1_9CHLO
MSKGGEGDLLLQGGFLERMRSGRKVRWWVVRRWEYNWLAYGVVAGKGLLERECVALFHKVVSMLLGGQRDGR